MSTETLTEWLLAAIAEDEKDAEEFWPGLEAEFPGAPIDFNERLDRAMVECEAKREIVESLVADTHATCEDPWYTCPAATEEREGESSCRDDAGTDCECGRDYRLDRYVRLLALPYADRPGYLEEWRP